MTESSPAPADPSEHGHDEKADDAVNMNVLTKNMMHLKLKRLQKRRAPFAIQERLILLEYSVCSLLQSILKLQCLMRRIMWEWKTTSDEELTNNYEFHGDCKVSLFDEENYNEDEESLFRKYKYPGTKGYAGLPCGMQQRSNMTTQLDKGSFFSGWQDRLFSCWKDTMTETCYC